MANKYDPPGMKRGAEQIGQELKTFSKAKDDFCAAMDLLGTTFMDETGVRLIRMYKQEAKPAMEELEQTLTDFVALLKMCATKFGNAIDNGNSYLSW